MPSASTPKSPYHPILLASADTSGLVLIWDVMAGVALHSLSEGNRPIQGNGISCVVSTLVLCYTVHVYLQI